MILYESAGSRLADFKYFSHFLAMGTDMCSPLRYGQFDDRRVTAWAGLPGPPEYLQPAAVIPCAFALKAKIADRRTLEFDGFGQDGDNSRVQNSDLSDGNSCAWSAGINGSMPKDFIAIDIPQTCDNGLVQQEGFNLPGCTRQNVRQEFRCEFIRQRFWTQF